MILILILLNVIYNYLHSYSQFRTASKNFKPSNVLTCLCICAQFQGDGETRLQLQWDVEGLVVGIGVFSWVGVFPLVVWVGVYQVGFHRVSLLQLLEQEFVAVVTCIASLLALLVQKYKYLLTVTSTNTESC